MFNFRERVAVATLAGRTVYNDERSCVNCRRQEECWGNALAVEMHDPRPHNFRFRAGWSEERWMAYIKSVYGGICGQFWHPNDAMHARMAANAEANAAKYKLQTEWEE